MARFLLRPKGLLACGHWRVNAYAVHRNAPREGSLLKDKCDLLIVEFFPSTRNQIGR
jgi:hypothetical protein